MVVFWTTTERRRVKFMKVDQTRARVSSEGARDPIRRATNITTCMVQELRLYVSQFNFTWTALTLTLVIMLIVGSPVQATAQSQQQNQDILNELKAIRQLLEKLAGPLSQVPRAQ